MGELGVEYYIPSIEHPEFELDRWANDLIYYGLPLPTASFEAKDLKAILGGDT